MTPWILRGRRELLPKKRSPIDRQFSAPGGRPDIF
jgi:hypothetical protein